MNDKVFHFTEVYHNNYSTLCGHSQHIIIFQYLCPSENRTDAVDIHVCAFQPPKPSASCQDCLPALVSGSADEGK